MLVNRAPILNTLMTRTKIQSRRLSTWEVIKVAKEVQKMKEIFPNSEVISRLNTKKKIKIIAMRSLTRGIVELHYGSHLEG